MQGGAWACLFLVATGPVVVADARLRVEMPAPMQEHMLSNMPDHVAALDAILGHLAAGEWRRAAEAAERRLGVSSLDAHRAGHMAGFMPRPMQEIGTAMHRAASRFALRAQEGEMAPALKSLQEVTAACVACRAGYRLR